MIEQPDAPPAPAKSRLSPEMVLAGLLTLAVAGLHVYFLNHVGGLWRDEVNSLNIARGSWSQISHDSFPVLFPIVLRGWCGAGFGDSDLSLRTFGVLVGLSITAAFWISAWWLRRRPPLWSLVLAASNAGVIYFDTALRAYGLGSAMVALCLGAAGNFLEKRDGKSWLIFACTAILSVQTLFQNTALVAAICAGGCAVALRRKNFQTAGGIFLGGLAAAFTLLPYWSTIFAIKHATLPVRTDFDFASALTDLESLLEFPLPQFLWVWLALIGVVLVRALAGIFSAQRDDRSLFAIVILLSSFASYMIFLRFANFYVQVWYFLPLITVAAGALESSLPRLEGKFRSLLWGGTLATSVISVALATRVLDARPTNVDIVAKKIAASARPNDFAVVRVWPFGITFERYLKDACMWDTVPPITDHSTHRYDLVAAQMKNPQAMEPLLARAEAALRTGNSVWIVGGLGAAASTNPPPQLTGHADNEMVYSYNCNNQLDRFLSQHASQSECVMAGTNENVNFLERTPLFKISGWRN